MDIDAAVQNVGGCGFFQVFLFTAIYATKVCVGWTLMLMAFGIYNPGWNCLNNNITTTNMSVSLNMTMATGTFGGTDFGNDTNVGKCELFNSCTNVQFEKGSNTLVTEWGLLCSQAWIPAVIISIQMAGGLIGSFVVGPLSDKFGRKLSTYCFVAPLAVANLIAVFSVSWEMFAVLRFFMGVVAGGLNPVADVYPLEFVTSKWRTALVAIPEWNLGTAAFAFLAWLLRDWRHIHIATAALGFLCLLPVFWVPESIRWLALHGRIEEAKKVAVQICRMNNKPAPDTSFLEKIYREGKEDDKHAVKYTYVTLFRKQLRKRTLVIGALCFCLSLVYYAITYGIKSLSGNFYLNLLLFALVPIPLAFIVPVLSNILGRKLSLALWIILSTVFCFIVVGLHFLASGSSKGIAMTCVVLLASACLDAVWTVFPVLIVEQFPTAVRTSSTGFGAICSRVGSIIAPHLIPNSFDVLYISYLVLGIILLVCSGMVFLLSETNGLPLHDGLLIVDAKSGEATGEDADNPDVCETLIEGEVSNSEEKKSFPSV